MNVVMETDWVVFFGAFGGFVTVLGATIVSIILAYKGITQKLDGAATRREQIGTAIIDPAQTVLPPKEQP